MHIVAKFSVPANTCNLRCRSQINKLMGIEVWEV